LNTNPKCEPQLGKRGLYGLFGGKKSTKAQEMAMLWVLNLSDGNYSLLDIAERSQLEFSLIREAAEALLRNGLLRETEAYCLQNLKEVAIL
jgi:aminopeptidase-like protein